VLAESSDLKLEAFRTLYGEFGRAVAERAAAYHERHGGLSRLVKIERVHREILGIQLDEAAVADWGRRFSDMVEESVCRCPWVAGSRELLESLMRDGIKAFVVSGTPQEEMERIVRARGMEHFFAGVYGSPPLKPQKVREILNEHRLEPARCLFFGDAMTDYDAAMETGLRFIGRVMPGRRNPFPPGTEIIADFRQFSLAHAVGEGAARRQAEG
jgi:phosphoglycolate phosphatase-like HAD superfamily hydrolase